MKKILIILFLLPCIFCVVNTEPKDIQLQDFKTDKYVSFTISYDSVYTNLKLICSYNSFNEMLHNFKNTLTDKTTIKIMDNLILSIDSLHSVSDTLNCNSNPILDYYSNRLYIKDKCSSSFYAELKRYFRNELIHQKAMIINLTTNKKIYVIQKEDITIQDEQFENFYIAPNKQLFLTYCIIYKNNNCDN